MKKAYLYYALVCISRLSLAVGSLAQAQWYQKGTDTVSGDFSQGLATDGVDWYFSARNTLYKTNADYTFLIVHDHAIPDSLQDQRYNHIGDIAYHEGILYAPIEDISYAKPIIATYSAATLDYTGDHWRVPQSHIPWVAVEPGTGLFYSSEFSGVNKLFVYDPSQDFALINEVSLDTTLSRVQGGAFLGGFLYLACDNGDFIYEVDITTGNVQVIFGVPPEHEMEGIEAYDLDSGFLHFVVDTRQYKNVFYHYATPLARDVSVKAIVSPEHNIPIWSKITPAAKVWNIGENTELEFSVVCIIDTLGVELYRDRQTVLNLPSLADSTIRFFPWGPKEAASYNITFYTEQVSDLAHHNDTLRQTVKVSNSLDDFETGLGKWEIEAGWTLSLSGQGHAGKFSLWTTPRPYLNDSDNAVTLITPLDLSGFGEEDSIGITLWTKNWLEEGKDYLYFEVSFDNEYWSIVGSYSGREIDWAESSHSLDAYTGAGNENVRLRFRLVTDARGRESGARIDDVMLATGVSSSVVVAIYNLALQSYPNPFNSTSTIRFELPAATDLELTVYDLRGRPIASLSRGQFNAGYHQVVWNGRDRAGRSVPSGLYIARLLTPNNTKSIKMVLLK